MQDNDFSPQWADEGWDQMRQMLDEHMPVRRKRRAAWLPLAAAVALLAFAGIYLLWPAEPVQLEALRVELPGAAAKPTVPAEAASKDPAQLKAVASAFASTRTPADRTAFSGNSTPAPESPAAGNLPPQQTAKSTLPQAGQPSTQQLTAIPQQNTAQPTALLMSDKITAAPSPLHPLSPSPPHALSSSPTHPLSPSHSPALTLGLQATLLAPAGQAPDSYALGAFGSIGLSPRLYLRADIGWQQSNTRHTAREDVYLFEQNSGPDATEDDWALEATSGLDRMQTLNAGLSLGYRISPRFSLEGGLMYQHLLESAEFVRWEEAMPASAALTTEQNALLQNLNESGTISGNPLQYVKNQYFWQAGLRYRLSRRWGVAAHWQQALQELFPEENEKVRLQRIGISVAYRW